LAYRVGRLTSGYLQEEPDAGKPHVRICEAKAEWLSYSTYWSHIAFPFTRAGDDRGGNHFQDGHERVDLLPLKKEVQGVMPSEVMKFQGLEEENARLRRLVTVLSLDEGSNATRGHPTKTLRPAQRREALEFYSPATR
jgi:hypothetical protein